jgi:hypothetical protein
MKKNIFAIPTLLYFVAAAMLIAYFFPREGKFKYQFFEGKPWRYGLLTATNDFPIYKTDAQVTAEQDSARAQLLPYFRYHTNIEEMALKQLDTFRGSGFSTNYINYLKQSLSKLYSNGIISGEMSEQIKKEQIKDINLLKDNISHHKASNGLFTTKTAYEFVIDNCPSYLNKDKLKSYNVDQYIQENVIFDTQMTQKAENEVISNIPLASGMVQAGERIVDRGEIITPETYNVLRSMKRLNDSFTQGSHRDVLMIIGEFILVMGLILCFATYLWMYRNGLYSDRKSVLFMLLCITTGCVLTEICITWELINVYIIPFAIIPIVIRTFFDSRTAFIANLITILICSLMVPFPHEFVLLQLTAGMIVSFSLKGLTQRSQLIRCAFIVFASYAIIYTSLSLYQEADLKKLNWLMYLYFSINFILMMFSYILVYILEKTFGYLSNITLVELSNINTPILQKLSETCPGSFQHSLQVSIIASAAASRVGADAQLVRTGAMYHDIGKMSDPTYFTENQSGVNPHSQLSFEESAQLIINHIHEGIKIAEKANIPSAIIDFIRTHHGAGKVKYFYNSHKNKFPDQEIDEALFTYPGPNPFSKETGILMMADSIEAASRSLKEYTEENITQLVNKIISTQIEDGLLTNTPLTFRDVETIKEVFIEKLKTMYHTRVTYPDLKKQP